jgi:hypothetical protein
LELEIAKKPNQLIQAGQSLTPLQSKALFGMLAQFKFNASHERSEERLDALAKIEYEIPLSSLLPNLKSQKGGRLYKQAREQIEKMMAVTIRIDDGNELNNYNLVSHSVIRKDSSIVKAKFNRDIIPVLVNMVDSGYTEVQLSNILPLKSSYSIRIYELLLKNRKMKHIIKDGYILSIENFRYLLGIGEKQYKIFADFRKRVIEPSYKEINSSKTNLRYSYELLKKGRSYTDIRFYDIYLVSPVVEKDGTISKGVEQIDLFDDSPLSLLQTNSAMEIREKHSPEYISYYYKKALDVEKAGRLKTSLSGLFFALLNRDEDSFYKLEEKRVKEAEKKEQQKLDKLKKESEQETLFLAEKENSEIQLKSALKEFDKLPETKQQSEIKKAKKRFPFASDELLKEQIALERATK